jgi:seryl-tRNA synthetase
MLDIRSLREDAPQYRSLLARRGDPAILADVDQAIDLDARRREVLAEVEVLKARRNEVSREVGEQKRSGEDASDLIESMQGVVEQIRALDAELSEIEDGLRACMLRIPNAPDSRVPESGEDANVVMAEHGELPMFGFEPRTHWDLGLDLGILHLERGARIAGSGFPVLTGSGARLSRALIQFMLDLHADEHGYTEVAPPFLVNRESLTVTGQLPKFEEDQYRTDPDDLFLVPTAEVPVTNLHRDEILDGASLPLAYVAYTPCFRREAGAAGKDTRGMLRVHQFDKVELVRFTTAERSSEELEILTGHAERVLELLELPYRRVLLAGGDLGFANAITFDLEVWSPGVAKWLEVSSCSSYTDYQARRGNIRYRATAGDRPRFAHTLNGSGVALARTIVALLENNQNEAGNVRLPAVLHPYMGREWLEAP